MAGPSGSPDVAPPADLAPAAHRLFGAALPTAVAFAELLATEGVVRGLIGPRETARLWDRHLLNCAAVAELIPGGTFVVDVGSGAGLPGIVLSVVRPDLSVLLVEPLARRVAFLGEALSTLGLADRVTVVRDRAESVRLPRPAGVVTARAVAPLDRLAGWCLPLVAIGGRLLAVKGASAEEEIEGSATAVARLGGATPMVRRCGIGLLDPPTTVIEIVRERAIVSRPTGSSRGSPRRRGGSRRP